MNRHIVAAVFLIFIVACSPSEKKLEMNPAAEGFNKEGSDEKAVALADSVMKAMGGRQAYEDMRFIAWNFFGVRDLVWDKQTGRVRIDVPAKKTTCLLNIHSLEGKVSKGGEEITDADSLAHYLKEAKSIWINDSYWLVMPFKLKDSGVTLKYNGEDTTQTGIPSHVLTMTFENVGDTPENKYEVYVDQSDHLIKQWAYYKNADQEAPSAVWPWDNYKDFDGVLLSSDRSDDKGPRNVRVYSEVPDEIFTSFDPPALQ